MADTHATLPHVPATPAASLALPVADRSPRAQHGGVVGGLERSSEVALAGARRRRTPATWLATSSPPPDPLVRDGSPADADLFHLTPSTRWKVKAGTSHVAYHPLEAVWALRSLRAYIVDVIYDSSRYGTGGGEIVWPGRSRVDDDVGVDVVNSIPSEPVTTAELEARLDWVRAAPRDRGRLELIVRRPAIDEREVLAEGMLDGEAGLVGDNWSTKPSSSSSGGGPNPERQLTLMSSRLAGVVARSPERMALAGDQLYVDFDLSIDNAPAGTRLCIGTAVIELTEPPHLGCDKFVARFGREAMRFVNSPLGRQLRLRGANAKIVAPGLVRVGDAVEKLGPI